MPKLMMKSKNLKQIILIEIKQILSTKVLIHYKKEFLICCMLIN